MQRLERPPHRDATDFPEDIARFRRVLEADGATATDGDLAWAWREYSEETWCAGWEDPEGMSDEVIVVALRHHLRPSGG
ncbi:MAG: hypothetical protein E6Q97_39615 [Desulfurellales bacterium]|nr:MAG: hypothetical protein E6Q97_39615 [Desulfurellales bacterium]